MNRHPNCSECEQEAECKCSCKKLLCNIHVIEHIKLKHSVSYMYSHITDQDILSINQAFCHLNRGFLHQVSVLSAEQTQKTSRLYNQIRDVMTEYTQKIRSFKLLKQQLGSALALAKSSGKLLIDSSDVFVKSLLNIKSRNNDHLSIEKLTKLIESYGFVYPIEEVKEAPVSVSLRSSSIVSEEVLKMSQSVQLPEEPVTNSFWRRIRSTFVQEQPAKKAPDKCASCKKTICNNEPHCCHKCHSSTQNWHCTNCKLLVPTDQRLCLSCIKNFWQCQKCHYRNIHENNVCTRCGDLGNIPEVSVCGICFEPTPGNINCGVCGMKRNSTGCFWCSLFGHPHICDSCKTRSWLCKCGVINQKVSNTCVCGFLNKNIR